MLIIRLVLLIAIFGFPDVSRGNIEQSGEYEIHQLWLDCKLNQVLPFEVSNKALIGQSHINNLKTKNIITIIDFSKSSSEKRFF